MKFFERLLHLCRFPWDWQVNDYWTCPKCKKEYQIRVNDVGQADWYRVY